jgi:hypothetical protein
MSHLAEEYAKCCGVRIGRPVIKPHYFPILFDKYVTIHNDKKIQAKEYDYWPEVISLAKPFMGNIKFVQIGAMGEQTIEGVDSHSPTNSLKQCSYIIERSLAHVGIDSVPVHIASALDKPVVGIYSHTYASTCNPLWNKKSKAVILESDRGGNKPSFALEENPKTVNFIKPERVAQGLLDVLNISEKIKTKTLFMGSRSMVRCVEVIPLNPVNFNGGPILVRMDIEHNEDALRQILQKTSAEIITNKPISEDILKSQKIQRLSYEAPLFDEAFLKTLVRLGTPTTLVCTDEKNLEKERVKYFDCLIHQDKKPKMIEDNKNKAKDLDLKSIKIKSGRKIFCGDKVYESHFDRTGRKNKEDLFVDLDWLLIYNRPHE